MTATSPAALAALLLTVSGHAAPPTKEPLPGFRRSPWFRELVCERWIEGDVRVLVSAAADYDPSRPNRLVIYATPNGSTIE